MERQRIFENLIAGEPVGDALLDGYRDDEREAIRTLEKQLSSHRRWKNISSQILELALLLNRGAQPEEILTEIVKQAKTIIGSDIAYISLNDQDSDITEVVYTESVMTEAFRSIRLPLGTGVLGLVATKDRPTWTTNHAKDPQVTHLPEVDAAVVEEGIVAILGAPIRSDGAPVGALMVADRRPRKYSPDEVMAIDSMASLAAVSLENSHLLTRLNAQIAHSDEQQGLNSERVSCLERLLEFETRITDVLEEKEPIKKVVELVATTLKAPVWLGGSRVIATHSGRDGDKAVTSDRSEEEWSEKGVWLSDNDSDYFRAGIGGEGAPLGELVVTRKPGSLHELKFAEDVVNRAANALAGIIVFQRAMRDADTRRIDDIAQGILQGRGHVDDLRLLKKYTGFDWDSASDIFIVVAGGPTLTRETLKNNVNGQCLVTEHREHYCALVLPRAGMGISQTLAPLFKELNGAKVAVGAAAMPADLNRANEAHMKAERFSQSAAALGVRDTVCCEETLGTVGLIAGALGKDYANLQQEVIQPLVAWDKAYDGSLVKTAYAFFEVGQNVSRTAKELFIHANTVRQRLERIELLLGEGWNHGPRNLDIHFALRSYLVASTLEGE